MVSHEGKGITDQTRNILSNQTLLLGFFRSVAPLLETGSIPNVQTGSMNKKKADDDEDEDERNVGDRTRLQRSGPRANSERDH